MRLEQDQTRVMMKMITQMLQWAKRAQVETRITQNTQGKMGCSVDRIQGHTLVRTLGRTWTQDTLHTYT